MARAWPAPFVVIALVLGLSSGATAAEPQSESVRVVDLTPRFLEFHTRAREVDDGSVGALVLSEGVAGES